MSVNGIKRKRDNSSKRSKKKRKIDAYHSSSSEDEDLDDGAGIQLPNLIEDNKSVTSKPASKKSVTIEAGAAPESEDESASDDSDDDNDEPSDSEDDSLASLSDNDDDDDDDDDEGEEDEDKIPNDPQNKPKKSKSKSKPTKRDDPAALATSISKILSSKVKSATRADPVLSRSATAAEASASLQDSKLERAAKRRLREENHQKRERGHVKDVLALEKPDEETARVIEEERRLRKLAQRGVVRLFNAVRAAQVKGEEEAGKMRSGGVGHDRGKERVTEMSKKGFLDLLNAGA